MKTETKRTAALICLVLLSGLFLFDPMVGFRDFLPDAIGYLLLFFGLYRLSDLNEEIASARRLFTILLAIGVGQMLLQLLFFVYLPMWTDEMNRYELPVWVLTCSFLTMVYRILLLVPAFRRLLVGMERLTQNGNGEVALPDKKGKTRGDRLRGRTTVFVVVTSILSLLPELAVLTSFEAVAEDPLSKYEWYSSATATNQWFDWYPFANLFRMLLLIPSLLLGVLWLIRFVRYFLAILRDKPLLETFTLWYGQGVLQNKEMLTVRSFKRAILLLSIGAVFTLNLRMNEVAVFPNAVFALCVLFAMLCAPRPVKGGKGCAAASFVLLTCSVLQMILDGTYLKEFVPTDALYYESAYWHFLAVRIFGAVEAVATLFLTVLMLFWLSNLICAHTSVHYEGERELSMHATERLHRDFRKRLYTVALLFALACGVNAADAILRVSVGWLWLVSLPLSFFALWNFFAVLQEFREQIYIYYRSDGVHKQGL